MFVATSMASELVPASVILFRVVPGQKSVVRRDGSTQIFGKAVKKSVCERKTQRCKRIAKTCGNGEEKRAQSTDQSIITVSKHRMLQLQRYKK
ncbi:hypothetical protein NPIL_605891 [Nephila pilipes]|uniref:Uncharacterized protein n=1 Tax=Nephila pilipes TaxID=299642 RepID=A0A8X6NU93_NEPPI|nr:hypothetical protein NPIL_605891 [Nephila pilipes]